MFSSRLFGNDSLNNYLLNTLNPRKDDTFIQLKKMVKTKGIYELEKQLNLLLNKNDLQLSANDLFQLALSDPALKQHILNLNEHEKLSILNVLHNFSIFSYDHKKNSNIKLHPILKEGNGQGIAYFENLTFFSWENSIQNIPQLTFIPKSFIGLQNIIKWANKSNKRVRAAGYRHSCSEMYSDNDEILISTLDLDVVTDLPAKFPKLDVNNEFQFIKLIGEAYEKNGQKKIKCQIGGSTCNYHFQDWVHDPNSNNQHWTLPLNVIMTEITFAGSNATICHGAGIKNKTLSDLVTEIEFINVKGELQKVNDPQQLKAAAGCFGLLGFVTSITLELDEMTYANLKRAKKKLLANAIPPATPLSTQILQHLSDENIRALNNLNDIRGAQEDFIYRCENDYYSEWFWFPLHDQVWVNTWRNDGDKLRAVRYPSKEDTEIQNASSYSAHLSLTALGDHIPQLRRISTMLTSHLSMAVLPDKQDITCSMEDALHFRKGIQNFKVKMMEIEIPIPNIGSTNKADWKICQKAWWDVIESVYSEKNLKYYPMRTTLEMRIMGGSDVIMAAQYGNQRTCSIDILTPLSVKTSHWTGFLQEVLDKWAALKDDQGKFLNIRPHWAKYFKNLMINREITWLNEWDDEQKNIFFEKVNLKKRTISLPIEDYLKYFAYKNQIKNFRIQLDAICAQGGYALSDIQERFSNSFWDNLLGFRRSKEYKERFHVSSLFSKLAHRKIQSKEHKKHHIVKKVKHLLYRLT